MDEGEIVEEGRRQGVLRQPEVGAHAGVPVADPQTLTRRRLRTCRCKYGLDGMHRRHDRRRPARSGRLDGRRWPSGLGGRRTCEARTRSSPMRRSIAAGRRSTGSPGRRVRAVQDARDGEEPRRAPLRRQHGHRRVQRARRQGRVAGHRRRLLPGRRRRRLQGREQGQVRAAHGQGALHRPAVRRDRHPVAQHDLDDEPRHLGRAELRGHHLLRRPGASW